MLPLKLKYFFQKRSTIAKSHIKNLLQMAKADGNISEAEILFLKKISLKNKIPENSLKVIWKNMETIPFLVPFSEQQKFSQLYDLVQMMNLDNIINSEELKLCQAFATKLGYPQEISEALIDTINYNIKYGLSYHESMKRIGFLLHWSGLTS